MHDYAAQHLGNPVGFDSLEQAPVHYAEYLHCANGLTFVLIVSYKVIEVVAR